MSRTFALSAIVATALAVLLASTAAWAADPAPPGQVAEVASPQVESEQTFDEAAATARPDLQTSIAEYLSGQPGQYGVAVRDLATGESVVLNADETFEAASTYKLLVMYRVYQGLYAGTLRLEDPLTITEADDTQDLEGPLLPGQTVTVGDALESMITVSSNTAAFALTRVVGGWGVVETAAGEIGMPGTWLEGEEYWTTPADMLALLTALAQGQLVSPEASQEMIDLLARQAINDRLPALLPAGASVAHKTGDLPGVRNDVGIVSGPSGGYVICVLSQGVGDEAPAVIAELSRLVYEQLSQ